MLRKSNPLNIVCAIFVVLALFYIFSIWSLFKDTTTPINTLRHHYNLAVGLLITVCFIITYLRQSIVAWWMAVSFLPIQAILYYAVNPFEIKRFLSSIWIYILIIGYLVNRYEPYKEYIKISDDLDHTQQQVESINSGYSANPLYYIAIGAMGVLLFDLLFYYRLYLDHKIPEIGTNQLYRVVQTGLFIMFLLAYKYRSVLAWLLCAIWVPIVWIIYYRDHVFDLNMCLIAGIGWVILLGYLLSIYPKYLAYIKHK